MLVCEAQFYRDIEIIRKTLLIISGSLVDISNTLKEVKK